MTQSVRVRTVLIRSPRSTIASLRRPPLASAGTVFMSLDSIPADGRRSANDTEVMQQLPPIGSPGFIGYAVNLARSVSRTHPVFGYGTTVVQ